MGGRSLPSALVLLILCLTPVSCWYYSFSGATIPSHLNSVAIPLAEDRSISTVSGLDERLTQFLVDRFVGQTRLILETSQSEADAVLNATIQNYQNRPTSVGGDERATRNRVTISVNVRYVDVDRSEDILSRTFSGFEEYDPLDPSLEEEAALAALEKVADDIFTAATSNW
ncbi:MAG: LptE family protein [Rhodothermales bacterium]|nr:LptE family protein [Rhodothermales bacterium]